MSARFVGTWLLVSQESINADGRRTPSRGEGAAGILMYDGAGNMAVQLMRTDAHAAEYTDLNSLETAMRGFLAYYGRYDVDETQQVIRHHVIGASYFGYRGTIQVRRYSLIGDMLTLQAASAPDDTTRVLIWRRVATA